ncbi:MAG: RsmB/NOP family class I SAM-dependent RNA methyltransferase, partial [Pseudomonadota bacterium]
KKWCFGVSLSDDQLILHITTLCVLCELRLINKPDYAVGACYNGMLHRAKLPHIAKLASALIRWDRRNAHLLLTEEYAQDLLPKWLLDMFHCDRKYHDAIAQQHLQPAPIDIFVKQGTIVQAADAVPLEFSGSYRLAGDVDIARLSGYDAGEFWVQDVAATLPVRLANPQAGMRVLDMCAAPGGKTMQLANMGCEVTALDSSRSRLKQLHENLRRTNHTAKVICADALDYECDALFDMVLLDAPCSATGTIRRHPELPWSKSQATITALPKLQLSLLLRAAQLLKPRGWLVYCVCSLLHYESDAVIAAFLAATGDQFLLSPITRESHAGLSSLPKRVFGPRGTLQTDPAVWAEIGGMDGFYCAILQKNA